MWNRRPRNLPRSQRPRLETLESRQLLTAGMLDEGFGVGGILHLAGSRADDVVILPEGDIVAAGTGAGARTGDDFQLIRLRPDGTPRTGFGAGGKVLTDFNKGPDSPRAVALQVVVANGRPETKIIVGGSAGVPSKGYWVPNDALARYNLDGTLDTTFGGGGKTATGKVIKADMLGIIDLVVQADGKIVTVSRNGSTNGGDLVLARYNANGTVDTTFNGTGIVRADQLGNGQIDGGTDHTRTVLSRYNADGTPDTGFGPNGNGRTITDAFYTAPKWMNPEGHYIDPHVALQTVDGQVRIVLGGITNPDIQTDIYDYLLERYDASGRLDPTFGAGGRSQFNTGANNLGYDYAENLRALAVQPDGKVVAVGLTDIPWPDSAYSYNTYSAARFLADGTPDESFGIGGVSILDPQSSNGRRFNGVALQADGAIVAVGYHNSTQGSFIVARMQGDASLMAAAVAPSTRMAAPLDARRAASVLDEALARWRATGADTSGLGDIAIEVTDLPGRRLAYASGGTIALDAGAAGRGWSVGRTTGRGRVANPGRMDLLSAVEHEIGHMLGHDHARGVMAAILAPGARRQFADAGNIVPVAAAPASRPRLAIEAFRARVRRPRAVAHA